MNVYRKMRKTLRPARIWLYDVCANLTYRAIRFFKPPHIPENADGKVLIHLGCGEQDDPRYINVDGVAFPHVNFVSRVEKLPMFPDEYADLVYACHVLEHISHQKIPEVLREWQRVLKKGGVLRLSVPDFDKVIAMYETEGRSVPRTLPPLMGTHENGEFDFHRAIFNKEYLSTLLKEAGFRETREWSPETAPYYSFSDWAGPRKIHGMYPISLNLEGVK
jgi:predicted SAM-dependent methyltransferase